MALWGNTDALASAPKHITRTIAFNDANVTSNVISLAGKNTFFNTGDAVKYSVVTGTTVTNLVDGTLYYVRALSADTIALYDTQIHAITTGATTGRLGVADPGTGTYTLQRIGVTCYGTDHEGNPVSESVIFVSQEECVLADNKARGIRQPGWWFMRTYPDAQNIVRYKAECLVAMTVLNATSGDAGLGIVDDQLAADKGITIVMPYTAKTMNDGATSTIAATVTTDPGGDTGSLTYAWQKSDDDGDTWTAASGGIYSNNTTATITITAPTFAVDQYQYRLKASGTGYADHYSAPVVLTITPAVITIDPLYPEDAVESVDGGTAEFTVNAHVTTAATGSLAVTYLWQVCLFGDDPENEASWITQTEGTGGTTHTLTTATTLFEGETEAAPGSGFFFRVAVSRLGATTKYSRAAELTVSAAA